ncbi:MAG: hypothetical protein ACLFUJ_04235 [Phycisphaerae bacterium]
MKRFLQVLACCAIGLFAAVAGSESPATVTVIGQGREVNGQSRVPVGLFGVHNFRGDLDKAIDQWGITMDRKITWTPNGKPIQPRKGLAMFIECWYDRYQPAVVLQRKDFKSFLEDLARKYGQAAKESPWKQHIVEFWNEPYLNWATKPGVNYDGRFYESEGRKPGAPMTIKGWDKPTEYLVWDGPRKLAMIRGQIDYVQSRYLPDNLKPGDVWKRGSRKYQVVQRWWGKDPTQKHYWSGKQNVQFYLWMYEPFARTLKQTNPDVTVLGGWGFNIYNEGWDSWRMLYKPLIDQCWQWTDGIHEHHYGGDTRKVAASYEVAYAYTLGNYGKRLKFYNTEAGGMLDPEQPVARPVYHGSGLDRLRGGMTYTLRDIIGMVADVPDKAAARATHQPDPNGEKFAYLMLRDLRGRLMHVTTDQPKVWAVASVNGDKLAIVIFNDNAAQNVRVQVNPPAGTKLKSGLARRVVAEGGKLQLKTETLDEVYPDRFVASYDIGTKQAQALTFQLDKAPGEMPTRSETQFVSKDVLTAVTAANPAKLSISIPAKDLAGAEEAYLRISAEGNMPIKGTYFTVNGRQVLFPSAANRYIVDIPLPPDALKTENEVQVRTTGTGSFLLHTASLFVVSDSKSGSGQ